MGLIHGDIRPKNILLDGRYNIRTSGFSCVYVHQDDKVRLGDLLSSEIIGTWTYQAPEIVELAERRREEPYSAAVDHWSLGCIVFELESTTRKHKPMFERYRDVIRYAAYRSIEVPYPPFEAPSKQPTTIPWVEMDDETARRPVIHRPLDPSSPPVTKGKINFSQFRWNYNTEVPMRKRKQELALFSC
ncbi:hypothetical protein C0995_016399 [Termitomyces sp. Mi166|nr:hypothetical protein C0995_016399 [Termitomyces sp. Mi166\